VTDIVEDHNTLMLQLRLNGKLVEVTLNLQETRTVRHLKLLIHEQFGNLDGEPFLPDTLVCIVVELVRCFDLSPLVQSELFAR